MRHPLRARHTTRGVLDDRVVGDLVAAYGHDPVPEPNAELAMMLELGASARFEEPTVARAARMERHTRPHWLEIAFRPVFVGVTMAASLVLLGGLAVAGELPTPIQRGVANAAAKLGIDLPGSTAAKVVRDTKHTGPADAPAERDSGTPNAPGLDSSGADPAPAPADAPTGAASGPEAATEPGSPPAPPAASPTPTLPTVAVPALPTVTVPTAPKIALPEVPSIP